MHWMTLTLSTGLLCLAAGAALAVGDETEPAAPPEPTETTELCEEAFIWDPETEVCVPIEDAPQEGAALVPLIRELAHHGRYSDAASLLDRLPPDDGFTLKYRGLVARQSGDFPAAQAFYLAAIVNDPKNHLARAYYGIGLVGEARFIEAALQLREIRAQGGAGGWPARALTEAIAGGAIHDY